MRASRVNHLQPFAALVVRLCSCSCASRTYSTVQYVFSAARQVNRKIRLHTAVNYLFKLQ